MKSLADEIKRGISKYKDNEDKYLNYLEEGISEFEALKQEGLVSPRGNNLIPIEEKFSKSFCFNVKSAECA